jgi:hypothetical protein
MPSAIPSVPSGVIGASITTPSHGPSIIFGFAISALPFRSGAR